MSASYNGALSRDLDWVRFLIGDRDPARAAVSDEEILAALAEERDRYLAAARCGELILAQRKGLVSKSVGDLSLSYDGGGTRSAASAYKAHVDSLRAEGCRRIAGAAQTAFRVL